MSTNNDLGPGELKEINEEVENGFHYGVLRMLEISNFGVGDVLVKQQYNGNDEDGRPIYENCPISAANHAPQKFKVVHVDRFGVPWIKRISASNGKLSNHLATIISHSSDAIRFVPDKSYAEAIITGDENFDPLAEAKRERKRVKAIKEENKKRLFQSQNPDEVEKVFKSLKIGKVYWFYDEQNIPTVFRDKDTLNYNKIRVDKVFKAIKLDKYITSTTWGGHGNSTSDLKEAQKLTNNMWVMSYTRWDNWAKQWTQGGDDNIAVAQFVYKKCGLYLEEPELYETQ